MPVFSPVIIIVVFRTFYATVAAAVSDIPFESPFRGLAGFTQIARSA
jgi:hypothetical protein